VLGSWLHLAFLLVVGMLGGFGGAGGSGRALRLVSVFSLAQVAGVLVVGVGQSLGMGEAIAISTIPAEIGFAVGVALLARQAMEPVEKRRRLEALAGAAGLVHGLGIGHLLAVDLGEEASGLIAQLLAVLGMDAVHLAGAVGATALIVFMAGKAGRGGKERSAGTARARGAVAYSLGATAMALAISLSVQGGAAEAGAVAESLQAPRGTVAVAGAGLAASRRLAPTATNAPIQSFLSVEPFEVRHEAMFRLAGLSEALGLDPDSTLEVADQPALADRLAELALGSTAVLVDGEPADAMLRRVDFMTVDPTGALPRPNPVPEPVMGAVVGVIVAYPTGGMPAEVSLRWDPFPATIEAIPATVIDPEAVASQTLSADLPVLTWENVLIEDPIPTVEAVEIEPTKLPVPLISLPLLLVAAILVFIGMKGSHPGGWIAAARVILALAFIVGPVAQTAVVLPGSSGRTPSERQARRILAGLLPNIYRALEFREETLIYDRLAVSVTGETLTDVYLEQRQALEMEERGGAQARVETVEVLQAGEIEAGESGSSGFSVRATWTVGGMVTHFGHRHFRQNRYDARIGIVPESGTWKIQSIEVLEQERVR
jgi:hypothetical protein